MLIANYEESKRTLEKLKTQEDNLKNEIQRLEKLNPPIRCTNTARTGCKI